MNKYFLALLLLMPFLSFSQQLKIKQLLEFINRDYSYFETIVSQNGFQYFKHKNEENYEAYGYAYNRTSTNKSSKFVNWTIWKNNNLRVISYQTSVNTEYITLKSEMTKLGFKFTKMDTYNEQQFLYYNNGKREITIVTGDAGNGITFYEFSFSKIN